MSVRLDAPQAVILQDQAIGNKVGNLTLIDTLPTKVAKKIPEPKNFCPNCSEMMIECNYCRECRLPIQLICTRCETVVWDDMHELCYCQLDLISSIFNSFHTKRQSSIPKTKVQSL